MSTRLTITLLGLSLWLLSARAPGQITTRVSVQSDGSQCECDTGLPTISADGRYIAQVTFCAIAPNDTNGNYQDVYVHDRLSGLTELVSVSSTGQVGNVGSATLYYPPTISGSGRYVAFYSYSNNLVPNDLNGALDCFVHDREKHITELVSQSATGIQGNGDSGMAFISGDGRFVAFTSAANNLVNGDSNGRSDVFVFDRQTRQVTLESVSDLNLQGDGDSYAPVLSFGGHYVAFESTASNLVANDTNGTTDIFVRDRITHKLTLLSVDSNGMHGNNASTYPSISADGRYVVFQSIASNLVAGDTNGKRDVFIRDVQAKQTSLVSLGDQGQQGNGDSGPATVSGSGSLITFHSFSSNLVPNDTNNVSDVFVRNRGAGTTRRISVATDGTEGNLPSYLPVISSDGRFVVFDCDSTNIVPGDTNGWRDDFVHGPEFTLEIEPRSVLPGQSIAMTIYEGVAGNLASVWVTGFAGNPALFMIAKGAFDPQGNFGLAGIVPPGIGPLTVTFQGFALAYNWFVDQTEPIAVTFR
ncbi:MAG: hypothetical protein U1E76_26395 [Planctomycetota bacterium]